MSMNVSSDPDNDLNLQKDPIWGTPVIQGSPQESSIRIEPSTIIYEFNSPRCGGRYSISQRDIGKVRSYNNRQKARLTSWLIRERQFGEECPHFIEALFGSVVKYANDMTEVDRADAILKYIKLRTNELGKGIAYASGDEIEEFENNFLFDGEMFASKYTNHYKLIASSESINCSELTFLLKYLERRGWIDIEDDSNTDLNTKSCLLTIEGYTRLAKIQEINEDNKNSSSGFMAMWFDDTMKRVWEKAFKPGIINAGYEPMRISDKHHNNNIVDEIIAEIRRSRFVVADLTHDAKTVCGKVYNEVRGSVYYEAGFAHGLNIPVIFTCRKGCKVHFDVQQYNYIFWQEDKLEELQENLMNRITGTIGDGPIRSAD